jgi:hypothetical protein
MVLSIVPTPLSSATLYSPVLTCEIPVATLSAPLKDYTHLAVIPPCSHLPIATSTPLPRIRIQRRPPNTQVASFTHCTSTVTSRAGAVVLGDWFRAGIGFWKRVRDRDDGSC